MNKRSRLNWLTLGALTLWIYSNSYAQIYPSRPIRLVVNFPAGGNVDAIARLVTGQLEQQGGWHFVVDNRAGANGIIGSEIVAHAPPDGYTMLFSPVTIVSNQVANVKVSYDVRRDFAAVTNIGGGAGYLMVVKAALPVKSVKELIAAAKIPGARMTYGTSGIAGTPHFTGELFNMRAGTRLIHVPYKGVPQAMTALIGGEIDVSFFPPAAIVQHVKEGRVRALAFTGEMRWNGMPEIPTVAEAALPGFEMRTGWQGWFAPARTAPEIVIRMQTAVSRALQTPKVRDFLLAGGYEPVGDSPEHFRQFIETEFKRYSEIATVAKIKVD